MHVVIRRYTGVNTTNVGELVRRANEQLVPRLAELPGFCAYYLVDGGDGVVAGVGVFESRDEAEASSWVAAEWIREEALGAVLPGPPAVTSGEVVLHVDRTGLAA